MLTLTIIRHAKSAWDQPGIDDHDRALNERGLHAAPLVGRWLATHGWRDDRGGLPQPGLPDHWLSSTATRARMTAEIMAGECGLPLTAVYLDRRLYHASGAELMALVREAPACRHLALFGHNPGLEEFACELLGNGEDITLKTAAVVCLALPQDEWKWVDHGSATLRFFTWPAKLEQGGCL